MRNETKNPVSAETPTGRITTGFRQNATDNSILAGAPTKGNPAMCNILPREKQIEVLHHLVEGNTLRSTARLTGVHRTTIMHLMVNFGQRCKAFMDAQLRGLTLRHVEVDEIWTFVGKKQGRLTPEEKAECYDIGDVYLWTALDQDTKLVAQLRCGQAVGRQRPQADGGPVASAGNAQAAR